MDGQSRKAQWEKSRRKNTPPQEEHFPSPSPSQPQPEAQPQKGPPRPPHCSLIWKEVPYIDRSGTLALSC